MDCAKKAAGRLAAEWIEPEMIVGLGTGSTATFFIQALIEKDLKIQAVASSEASAILAKKGGIRVVDINDVPHIDITVDGADEIDLKKRMIKGGGGAHTREKILAASSKELVIIIDESKLVPSIGKAKLPIEITRYGSASTKKRLELLGYFTTWRVDAYGSPFVTDNQNLILDIHFSSPPLSPEGEEETIIRVPGVIETGFFFHLVGRVIVGSANGSTRIF